MNLQKINELQEEKLLFSIYDVSDFTDNKRGNRAYIRSDSKIWKLWRELILPKISYLSILKLLPTNNSTSSPIFYFRILLDYQFRSIVHPKLSTPSSEIIFKKKSQEINKKPISREGASKYRKQVIEYMSQCPFTKISDDKLFDQGYITFTDKGELICGTQLSNYTWEKLNINPNAKNIMRIYPENREKYLEFHRKYVFQDNIDDLI